MNAIEVTARVIIPLDDIVDKVGPEVSKTLLSAGAARSRAKIKSPAATLNTAVDRVIHALDQLERAANTVGEPAAHRTLMARVRDLRLTRSKLRSK